MTDFIMAIIFILIAFSFLLGLGIGYVCKKEKKPLYWACVKREVIKE